MGKDPIGSACNGVISTPVKNTAIQATAAAAAATTERRNESE